MDVHPSCHALDNLGHRSERNSLVSSSNVSSLDEAGCFSSLSLSVSPPQYNHKNVRTKYSKIRWLPAGEDLVPRAEYCPQAIIDYTNGNHSVHDKKMLALNVRKHLSFLGWKIEFSKDKEKNVNRLRYTSPENVVSLSLIQVCHGLEPESAGISSISEADTKSNVVYYSLDKLPESTIISPNPEAEQIPKVNRAGNKVSSPVTDESQPCTGGSESTSIHECTDLGSQQSHESTQGGSNSKKHLSISPCTGDSELITQREYVHVENKCFPKAVEEYVNFEIRSGGSKNAVKVAKEHLSAVGWKFFLFHKKHRKELRYEAPCGKVFISLKRACIWYLSKKRLRLSNTSTDEVVQKSKGLMAQTRLGSPPLLDREGNLTTHDGFRANQFPDSSLMPSFSKGLNDAVRTQGSEVLQRERMQGASQDSCVLLQRNNKDDLLGLPEKDTESEHFIKQMHDVNPKRRAKQVGTPSTRQDPSTILSWLIDCNVILPRAIVLYRKKDGTSLKEGRVTPAGILCSCCEHVFNLSKFEAHAGSTYHRPAANIFLEDGQSIRECQLKLKCDKSAGSTRSASQRAKDHQHTNSNDQICSSCRYGGGLLLCDQCPSSYHKKCLGLKEVPAGDWFCPSCCCGICNSRRCNKNTEPNISDRFLNCAQCERQYHMECLRSKGILKHDGCAEEDWFCNNMCEQIHAGLQKLLGKPVPIGIDNLTWTLLKYSKSEDSHQENLNNDQLMECYSKLNVALGVMHECFEPVKEPLTGRDLVEDVIFSRWSKLSRLNFQGFYTVLLEKDEQLVTVATMRVYGEKVAEIPLVATRFEFRRQGMCRILMDEIEKKLMELGVRQIVLPSASSVLKTWTNAFGFSVLSKSERLNFLSYTFLEFQGTVMCHKLIKNKPCDLIQRNESHQNVSEHMSRIDSMDVEGSTAVSKVIQMDGAKEIEMIQQSSRGIVYESGDQFHTNTDSDSEESTDDYSVEYKRRKVSGRETYPSYKRKQGAMVA